MTIHSWFHWFWVTYSSYNVLVVLLAWQVNAQPVDRKLATTSGPNDVSGSNPPFNSDMDDTFNGENTDVIIPYPVKKYHTKYMDPLTGKKHKNKLKTEESSEKIINIVEEQYEVSISRLLASTIHPEFETEESMSDEPLQGNGKFNGSQNHNKTEDHYTSDENNTTLEMADLDNKMAIAAATSVGERVVSSSALDAGSITGITLGIIVISGLFGAISFVLYRRRYLNKPQVLNDKSSTLDSSGYIDDTTLRVGIPLPLGVSMRFKENSEEMYSLDNDSFLNSLEAMTIQNYWTESVKHTKL